MTKRTAYIIEFGAPPVLHLHELVNLMVDRGWDCHVILSPTAASWVDVTRIATICGNSVRTEHRKPYEPDRLQAADTIIAAQVTFKSPNEWAQGHSDTLALGILNEHLMSGIPISGAVCAKDSLCEHLGYTKSLATLETAGVRFAAPPKIIDREPRGSLSFHWSIMVPRSHRKSPILITRFTR